ncbi:uncharacterized protein LOC113794957 isoform X2 [Dermatophagoides pteronyssinus]|uniref:uncharacterized protein LOC113794957 isoform X2 n=1 Tax=Dermatophagoides pteronyssinus TaxID=6956 RepID=UPI003F67849A
MMFLIVIMIIIVIQSLHEQNMNVTKMIIKALSNSNDFDEPKPNSSSSLHNCLKKLLIKNRKSLIDKLFIQVMLNIDLFKFNKLRLKVLNYTGLKQRIALAMTMAILHCIDVFLSTLVIFTTLNLGCLKYFNFIRIHMWNLWPFAIIDCINHLYCGYIFIRNSLLYFNISSIGLIFYASQLNSLNKMINDLFVNHRHIMNSRLNYLRQLVWLQFQRQHQHMTYCIMYSGHDLWNDVYFIGIMANIPLNIMCIYNLVFRNDSFNNQFMYLGFLISQMFVLSAIMLGMKKPSIKWQVNEFYERLTTTEIGFGFYCGRIGIINYHNSFQMNSLNRKLKKVFGNHRHIMNSRLNYLRQLVWRQFQRQHQHITHCIMYGGMEIWNGVLFMGIMANIPLNIMCIYNIVFKFNSLNNEFMYLGFIIFQTFILSTVIIILSEINFSAHQFKRQLPIIQSCMKKPTIKWQVNEFYERLTTSGKGFGFYCGRIAIINYHNSFQLLMSYFGFMLIMFKFFFNNNV